jgi:hypothetical protein
MDNSVSRARAHAQRLRFSGDIAQMGVGLTYLDPNVRERHYQNAVEICSALTPALWGRLLSVCKRLTVSDRAGTAFIHCSPPSSGGVCYRYQRALHD